jgi:hypothetical protein
MAYTRPNECGYYIYPSGDGVHFTNAIISDDEINVFLYELVKNRPTELKSRVDKGTKVLADYHLEENND